MSVHRHAAAIIAWANGAKIQIDMGFGWEDIEEPTWCEWYQYRVKPKRQPLPYYVRLARHRDGSIMPYGAPSADSPHLADDRWNTESTPNMRWCSSIKMIMEEK